MLNRFAEVVRFLKERYVASRELSFREQFDVFGLTDIAVLEAALAQKCLIVTADLQLETYLAHNKVDVLGFRLLRNLNPE